MRRLTLSVVCIALLLSAATAQQVRYAPVTCSNAPNYTVTFVTSINNSGTMVGAYFTDSDPAWYALVIKDGECTPLPGLSTAPSGAWSINEAGDIVGATFDVATLVPPAHGFLFKKDGNLSAIGFPGADSTIVQAINQSGTLAGVWETLDSSGSVLSDRGFLMKDGVYTDIMYPESQFTSVAGINASGECVGYWKPNFSGPETHGFLMRNGNFLNIDVPFVGATTTMAEAINDKGYIAGAYSTGTEPRRGFLALGSKFISVDYPGAFMTNVNGINNKGQMVGWYFSPTFELHAFIAELKP